MRRLVAGDPIPQLFSEHHLSTNNKVPLHKTHHLLGKTTPGFDHPFPGYLACGNLFCRAQIVKPNSNAFLGFSSQVLLAFASFSPCG